MSSWFKITSVLLLLFNSLILQGQIPESNSGVPSPPIEDSDIHLPEDSSFISDTSKAEWLDSMAISYKKAEQFGKAIEYRDRELDLYLSMGDSLRTANSHRELGWLYFNVGSYDRSIDHYMKALRFFEKLGERQFVAAIRGNMASVHIRVNNHKAALEQLRKVEKIIRTDSTFSNAALAGLYINMGLAYTGIPKLDSAMARYEHARSLLPNTGMTYYRASIMNNIGDVHKKRGNLNTALEHYQKARSLFRESNSEKGIGITLHNIGLVYQKMGEHQKAIEASNEALPHLRKSNALYFITDTKLNLSKAYESLGQEGKALEHLRDHANLNDSLKGSKVTHRITALEAQYTLDKKRQQLRIAQQKNELAELRQTRLYFIIGGIILLLIIAVLINRNLHISLERKKQEQKLLDQEQERLRSEVSFKQKEIEDFASHIKEKNQFLDDLKEKMEQALNETTDPSSVQKLLQAVDHNLYLDNDRKELELKIDQVHQQFLQRLKEKAPKLTKTDLRLCSLLFIGLTSKDIASIMNISPSSVKVSRNRLRKKLDLPQGADLTEFLRSV